MSNVDSLSVFRPWRRDRPHLQIGALALLTIVLCLRYADGVLAPEPLGDEVAYVTAAERVVAGQSPYWGLYLYPPALAYAGAAVIRLAGSDGLMLLFRAFNVLGVALLVWWSFALLPGAFRWRLAAAALYLAISPAVAYGLSWGNISLGIAAMIFLGLLLWPDRPILAGALLGASIAVKPVAPVAVLVMLLQGAKAASSAVHRKAGTIALALAGGLLLVPPYLREFLSLTTQMPPYTRNVALYRALVCFDVEPPALVLFAVVAILTVLFIRHRPRSPWEVLVIAIPATLLALPLVWSHTLLLTLPLQVAATGRAWQALRNSGAADRPIHTLHAVLVLGAVLAIQLSDGVGGIDNQAFWLQGLVILLPALAPSALSLYLLTRPQPAAVPSAA